MEKIKQLNTLIEQVCSQAHNQPPLKLYSDILAVIESRVDLPKHCITAISKKLTSKSKKILFITFDLLEYLSYNLQLPFFSQIATKEFLFKISGLMMNKETDALIMDKILKFVRCLDELFRPLQDFLPLFYQFEAGLLRKQYQIPYDYVSPYRPKQLKQYKKPEKKQQKKKPVVQPTKDEQKLFEQIRQKIILINEIISNSDPGQDIRKNDLLIELVDQLKQSQKVINSTIDENPSERILELALATNDDLVTTYRRFKDLQRNRKPELFIMAELASDIIKEESRPVKKPQVKKSQTKIESKPEPQKFQSIFEAFETNNSPKKIEQPPPIKIQSKKQSQNQNIFDLIEGSEKATEMTQASQIVDPFGLMDISPVQDTSVVSQQNSFSLDLLGNGGSNPQNETNTLVNQMFSLNLGLNQQSSGNSNPLDMLSHHFNQQPTYQSSQGLYQPEYSQGIYQQQHTSQSGLGQQFLMSPSMMSQAPVQQPIYQNITLNSNEQQKPKQKQYVDPQKKITDLSQFKF